MSGPKDYRYVLSAIRRAEIQRRRALEREARQAAVRARLEAQREQAAALAREMHLRRAQEREARQAAILSRLELQRQQAAAMAKQASERRLQLARDLASARHAGRAQDKQTNDAPSKQQELVDNPPIAISSTSSTHAEIATESTQSFSDSVELPASAEMSSADDENRERQKIDSFISELVQWQTEMRQDEDVLAYQSSESLDWQHKAAGLLEHYSSGTKLDAILDSIEQLVAEGKQIHSLAGERKAQFATRNEILADIVSSLQEIGFFVADPQYEDCDNPAGAVLVRATRGNETMTASVDLSDTIKSIWNGVADKKCKDAFFSYVESMSKRGIAVDPLRSDLQDRPTLLEKGAKELPTDGQALRERRS